RRTFKSPGDAAFRDRAGLRAVPLVLLLERAAIRGGLLCFRRQRGNPAFGTADDGRPQAGSPLDGGSAQAELAGVIVHGEPVAFGVGCCCRARCSTASASPGGSRSGGSNL